MAFHVLLLSVLVILQTLSFLNRKVFLIPNLIVSTIYNVGDCLVSCLIGYIMWEVCGPQKIPLEKEKVRDTTIVT